MSSSFVRVSSLLALVAMGACAGTTDIEPSGAGGSNGAAGVTGAAGTNDTGGTNGTAGTNGMAGTGAGGTGTPGTGGTVDPTGTAGTNSRGGTTGTAGTTGRGGTTGTAGMTGTAGRGGTTGTAGRGGTTGTAGSSGTTGSGGAGGCTITATSMLGTIPTVGIVTFTTNIASITSAEIRFGLTPASLTLTAPVDLTKTNYRTLLLGMKGSSSYTYRIVATSSAGTCMSQDYTLMTGTVPSSVPKPTVSIMNATAHSKGFVVTSSGISGTGAYIYDADGAPVWWSTGPNGTSRIQMSWDASKMYMMSLNVQNTGGGTIRIVDMDGANATTASGMAASHHDMTAIPGGLATLMWNSSGIDAPCSLIERTDSGTMTTIVANMNTVYNSNTFHTNSVHYYPSDNTYTLGDRNPNMYVKVSRTGQLIWQLGGSNPKDMTKFFSGAGTWSVNHGHHMLADGTFILFNNGNMGGQSVVRVFKLNTSNMTATSSLNYMGSVSSMVLGDAQFLPNGNILGTYSTTGQLSEVTSTGTLVATMKFSSLGYSEYRDSLYGPPPR